MQRRRGARRRRGGVVGGRGVVPLPILLAEYARRRTADSRESKRAPRHERVSTPQPTPRTGVVVPPGVGLGSFSEFPPRFWRLSASSRRV